jgi:hypothetical protein
MVLSLKRYRISRDLGAYSRSTLKFERHPRDEMLADLTADLLAGRTFAEEREVTFSCPDGWREHLKVALARRLLGRRYPARCKDHKAVVHYRQDILYPLADELAPPDRLGYPVIMEHSWLEGPAFLDSGRPRFATELEVARAFDEWMSRYRNDPDYRPPTARGLIRLLRSWGVNPAQMAVASAVVYGHVWQDPSGD